VTDLGLVHLKGLTKLTWIALSGPAVTDAGLVHLQRLPNLTGINLSGAHVNDAWLKQLHGLSKLRILELRDTKVTAEGIAALKKALPECRVHAKLPGAFQNSLGMEFVLVPKGKSWLGGGGGKPGTREVEIAHDFYLGKYDVTQEEWQKIMGSNPSCFSRSGVAKDAVKDIADADLKRFPVEMVSWEDVQQFLVKLNDKEKDSGWRYRLPKPVEWEYACRGGPSSDKSESAFDFYLEKPTNQLQARQANFEYGKSLKQSCKVGSYPPNRLGLHDMHGNVWQWCDDAEKGPDGAPHRVIRGGSYSYVSWHLRASYQNAILLTIRSGDIGFRLARVPIGKELVVFPK
jgi:formylglycine-generating enzyme required for sulfatase activity